MQTLTNEKEVDTDTNCLPDRTHYRNYDPKCRLCQAIFKLLLTDFCILFRPFYLLIALSLGKVL